MDTIDRMLPTVERGFRGSDAACRTPKADLGQRIVNSLTGDVDAIAAHYVRQEWIAIDPGITNDISFSQQRLAEFQVDSQSNDNTLG